LGGRNATQIIREKKMAKLSRTIDVSKFRKDITKNIDGISVGFETDPKLWINTGNYVLNYLISGDFHKGVPMGRVTMLAGESGSAKSYIASANLVKNAQKQGVFVVLIDTEHSLDELWLQKLGVDTSEDKLLKVGISLVDDVTKFVSDFMKTYKVDHGTLPLEDQPPVLFIVDSLGMLLTRTEINQAEAGDIKGDMGRKAKSLKHFVNYSNSMFEKYNVALVATNHTYASQDMFDPSPKISGGNGFIFASSIVLAMRKGKLKEDSDGNKTTEINGIRAICAVTKTRFNPQAQYKQVEIKIPFDTGMDIFSGLFELFEERVFTKVGNRFSYKGPSGEFVEFRKNITNEHLEMVMKDHPSIFTEEKKETLVSSDEE
jgi:RecA/RadA recombinase